MTTLNTDYDDGYTGHRDATTTGVRHAADEKCSRCSAQAVAFWPMVDPDIPAHPYCDECLRDAQDALLLKMYDEGLIGRKSDD